MVRRNLPERGRAIRKFFFWVADTGVGMTQAVKDRIYDPFFTTKEIGQGTGLGLSMVYGIVQEHKGMILVDSTPGEGTVFRLYFPLAGDLEGGAEPQASSEPPSGLMREGVSVLVVDDDEDVLELIQAMQERMGHHAATASGGEEALKLWDEARGSYDLVVTDYLMPGMDGKELSRRLREVRQVLPIVLMTGRHDLTVQDTTQEGVLYNKVLRKPFTYEEVERTVEGLLAGKPSPSA